MNVRPSSRESSQAPSSMFDLGRRCALNREDRCQSCPTVFARRAEDVEFDRVVQSLRPMREIRWDHDNLAGGHHDLLLAVVSEPELQCAFDHVCELLVVMGVARHRVALLEADLSEHNPFARDDPSRDRSLHGFGRLVLPPVVNRLHS